MTNTVRQRKVCTWSDLNRLPTLDPSGNLEFQRYILALAKRINPYRKEA